jgi:hypothetical protein
MKPVLLALVLTVVACGHHNESNHDTYGVYREEVSQRPTDYAESPLEVEAILRDAVQRGDLWSFHNTRWYSHRGTFLVRSVVLDDRTFKLVVN